MISNAGDTAYTENAVLPYGTTIDAESAGTTTNRRFTSYDRSNATKLDYAVSRFYDCKQGRFTQVDPLEMSAASLSDPQSLNLYAYVGNDPLNAIDPSGLYLAVICEEDTAVCDNKGCTITAGQCYLINVGGFGGGLTGGTGGGGGNPQNPTPVDRARELLGQRNCANFIAELISIAASLAVPTSSLITPSFGPLSDLNGNFTPSYDQYYGLNEYRRAVNEGRVTASGNSGRSGDVITYGTTRNYNTISWNQEFYSLGRNDAARHIIHESLHLVPNFGDFALAGAAHMLATRNRTSRGTAGNFANQSAASQYLNEQIARHCQ